MMLIRRCLDYVNWDRVGIGLSALCAVHCLMTPFVILSLPMMARYYLANPFFHLLMALLIIPVALLAFILGYRHHHNKNVLFLGIPGLLLVSFSPLLVHRFGFQFNEVGATIVGSVLLMLAHWINKRSCSNCEHHHPS